MAFSAIGRWSEAGRRGGCYQRTRPTAIPISTARPTDRLLLRPLIQPPEHRLVPQDAVGRLQHPVILIWKVQKLAGNSPPLCRRECRDPLRIDHPEILPAVNDQDRRVPV